MNPLLITIWSNIILTSTICPKRQKLLKSLKRPKINFLILPETNFQLIELHLLGYSNNKNIFFITSNY